MKKKILSIAIATTLILGLVTLTGCGGSKEDTKEKKKIVVGASPEPHAEILEQVKPILEKQGYTLEIKEFTDYITPNTALQDGSIDANFYQHIPYLEQFNKEKKGTDEMKDDVRSESNQEKEKQIMVKKKELNDQEKEVEKEKENEKNEKDEKK